MKAPALRGLWRRSASQPEDSAKPSARGLDAPHRPRTRPPRIVELAAYAGYLVAAWLLHHLPPRLSAAVIGRAAQLSYLLWPTKRAWSNRNFGRVLGLPPNDRRVQRLALQAYRVYGRYVVELMRLPRLSAEQIAAPVDQRQLDGIEPIWRSAKGGMILTIAHLGNNEAVAAAAAERGWPLHVIADDSSFPELFRLLSAQRESWGAKVIAWRNLREIYAVLRRGEMLVLPIDWGYRPDGIPVRLFGAWTTLPAGPATLAAKTGSVILPVSIRRAEDGTYQVSLGGGITVPSAAAADLQQATQLMADALQATVAAAPEQWYSFKPMWPATADEAAELERRATRMLGATAS